MRRRCQIETVAVFANAGVAILVLQKPTDNQLHIVRQIKGVLKVEIEFLVGNPPFGDVAGKAWRRAVKIYLIFGLILRVVKPRKTRFELGFAEATIPGSICLKCCSSPDQCHSHWRCRTTNSPQGLP
jgi:hypothetical protein